jgi:hypothetical protein
MRAFTIKSSLMAKYGRWDVQFYADLIDQGKLRVVNGQVEEIPEEDNGNQTSHSDS